MRMWSLDGLSIKRMRSDHMGSVRDALELFDGRILAWYGRSSLWRADGEFIQIMDQSIWGAIQLKSGRVVTHGNQGLHVWTSAMIELYAIEEPENSVSGIIELSGERFLSWENHKNNEQESHVLCIRSDDGELLTTLIGHTNSVYGAMELSDGRILSWGFDSTLRLWSSAGEPLAVMSGHSGKIYDAFELADGRILSSYQTNNDDEENENLLWTADGQFIRRVYENRGYVISQGRDVIYWDKDHNRLMGFRQGELVHEFVAETSIIAYLGTSDGGVALGDFAGNVHILKPQ